MLKHLKVLFLSSARRTGVLQAVLNSQWRQRRLLILCYHGVSLDDEHQWSPNLYMHPSQLRARVEAIRSSGCSVLSLEDGVARLARQELPPRSVVITFDDGGYDFHAAALPILQEFRFPATVYQATYYSLYNRPVFDVMCSYLLWKAGRVRFTLSGVTAGPVELDRTNFRAIAGEIKSVAFSRGLSAVQKDQLLIRLADALRVDYQTILRNRLLHLMLPEEAREVAAAGVDIQLHTHRHRVSRDRRLFQREIIQNRQYIGCETSTVARHFCYPSGVHAPEFPEWLREVNVVSGTTCEPGLAAPETNPFLLPRLVDGASLSEVEFEGWLAGLSSILPRRRYEMASNQFLEQLYGANTPVLTRDTGDNKRAA